MTRKPGQFIFQSLLISGAPGYTFFKGASTVWASGVPIFLPRSMRGKPGRTRAQLPGASRLPCHNPCAKYHTQGLLVIDPSAINRTQDFLVIDPRTVNLTQGVPVIDPSAINCTQGVPVIDPRTKKRPQGRRVINYLAPAGAPCLHPPTFACTFHPLNSPDPL